MFKKSKIHNLKFIIHNSTGWFCFFVSFIVYLLTAEPTASFWDCSEFITAAHKLEICHPPGAPLFLLMARLFTALAPDAGKVAFTVNVFSALLSAFTVLFLYFSITHITRRIIDSKKQKIEQSIIILSGAIGALAYAFSDTFWFSAVEGEVYGASSFFTAIVLWAMLKWEATADRPYSNRWLILIAYLIGLSIGVHLLNLLAIPAMALIFYYKKFKIQNPKLTLLILFSSFLILFIILYGIIPYTFKIAGYFELLFVNNFYLPYNTGLLAYVALLITIFTLCIWLTYKYKKLLLNTVLLLLAVILIGYSSYSMILIRSLANPPMNQNSPDNVFSLMEYLNREQYGERPLLYGPYYNAPEIDRIESSPVYAKIDGRYEIVQRKMKNVYDSRFCTFFPRMYSSLSETHVEIYKAWGEIKGRPVAIKHDSLSEEADILYKPTFVENLRFFFNYQLGHMYFRYFMWNFAGRQNDVQADGGIVNGNWISGISFVDAPRLGQQYNLPEHFKNDAGRNRYFLIPLLLGIIGMFWQLIRDTKYFWVVMILFFMTGIAIVVYLNQTPLQPRERDYAYSGSFYAFAIWIGMGVAAIYDILQRKIPAKAAALTACLLSLTAPVIMARQNFHDHDRSGRYTVRDVAFNYLNSCAPNAILFTVGDNDTFPLWYLQDVEGVRTDVRVVNMQYLCADWYINQMKQAAYDSPPLPVKLTENKYIRGQRDIVYAINQYNDTIPLRDALNFINSDAKETKFVLPSGEKLDFIMSRNFSIHVDKQKVLANGTVNQKDKDLILDNLPFRFPSSAITKGQWLALEIIAANNWERPIYWTACNDIMGLEDYLQLDGIIYRLVPIKTTSESIVNTGRIDSDRLYEQLMNVFRWEGINNDKVWLDNTHLLTLLIVKARHTYTRLAMQLLVENQNERAVEVLKRALELFPASKVPYDFYSLYQSEALYQAEMTDSANAELLAYTKMLLDEIDYFYSLPQNLFDLAEQNSELNVGIIMRIIEISEQYGQPFIGEYIKERLMLEE